MAGEVNLSSNRRRSRRRRWSRPSAARARSGSGSVRVWSGVGCRVRVAGGGRGAAAGDRLVAAPPAAGAGADRRAQGVRCRGSRDAADWAAGRLGMSRSGRHRGHRGRPEARGVAGAGREGRGRRVEPRAGRPAVELAETATDAAWADTAPGMGVATLRRRAAKARRPGAVDHPGWASSTGPLGRTPGRSRTRQIAIRWSAWLRRSRYGSTTTPSGRCGRWRRPGSRARCHPHGADRVRPAAAWPVGAGGRGRRARGRRGRPRRDAVGRRADGVVACSGVTSTGSSCRRAWVTSSTAPGSVSWSRPTSCCPARSCWWRRRHAAPEPPRSGRRSRSRARPHGCSSSRSGAVDVARLGKRAGHLSREELWGVDDALLTVLGLR